MKTLFLLLVVLTTFSIHTSAQSILSPRVGYEIDRVEKEYFGLFPSINGFVTASVISENDVSSIFSITSINLGQRKDTSIQIDTRILNKLSKYMENFESVRMNYSTVNYSVLKGFAIESAAVKDQFHDPIETTVETLDGTSITGSLLWAEDSSLVLWKSEAPYNWRTVSQDANVVPVTSIKSMRVERQGGFSTGARYGAYAGIAGCLIIGGIHYQDIRIRDADDVVGYVFVSAIFTAMSSVAGGIIGSIIQQDYKATIDGKIEKYLPDVEQLSEYSMIVSYPPPELVRLINK